MVASRTSLPSIGALDGGHVDPRQSDRHDPVGSHDPPQGDVVRERVVPPGADPLNSTTSRLSSMPLTDT
jgi:hypothetical protein